MRSVQRNKQRIYYSLRTGSMETMDEYGNATGEYIESYSDPVALKINVGVPKGQIDLERFGLSEGYSRVLATTDMDCPIAIDSILWIGVDTTEPYNYVVKKIVPCLNQLLIGLEEVNGEYSHTESD